MIKRWKNFVPVLMAVLATGAFDPASVCGAPMHEAGKPSCCAATTACACHDETPCRQTCSGAPVHVFDKQIAARLTATKTTAIGQLLFSLPAPRFATAGRVAQRSELKPPPLGGSPPQARLCLWLI